MYIICRDTIYLLNSIHPSAGPDRGLRRTDSKTEKILTKTMTFLYISDISEQKYAENKIKQYSKHKIKQYSKQQVTKFHPTRSQMPLNLRKIENYSVRKIIID